MTSNQRGRDVPPRKQSRHSVALALLWRFSCSARPEYGQALASFLVSNLDKTASWGRGEIEAEKPPLALARRPFRQNDRAKQPPTRVKPSESRAFVAVSSRKTASFTSPFRPRRHLFPPVCAPFRYVLPVRKVHVLCALIVSLCPITLCTNAKTGAYLRPNTRLLPAARSLCHQKTPFS